MNKLEKGVRTKYFEEEYGKICLALAQLEYDREYLKTVKDDDVIGEKTLNESGMGRGTREVKAIEARKTNEDLIQKTLRRKEAVEKLIILPWYKKIF